MPNLTSALRAEYQQLFDSCQIRPERQAEVNAVAERALGQRPRYEAVARSLDLPWYVVAVLHQMEASARFDTHLHNGDPLGARTVHAPPGRPSAGVPPFAWETSATDALRLARYHQWDDWSVPGILFKWEAYNGWGYRNFHPEVKSPYLWSFTTHYLRGKYIADGTFSASAVSQQSGAAALLRRLAEKGVLNGAGHDDGTPTPAATATARLHYSPQQPLADGVALQHFLNQFPGIFLREDGLLGPRTSEAFRQLFGVFLSGDPRAA
jgi:lysozyme family protein